MNNPLEIPLQKLQTTISQIKPQLVDAIGVEALQFIADNFRMQGYQGRTFIPWIVQKKPNYPRPHRILILDAHLIRSFIKTDSSDHTTISTDSPYARVHNEGYHGVHYRKSPMGTFGKTVMHDQNIPQRQFMPITSDDHPLLVQKCQEVIVRRITDAIK